MKKSKVLLDGNTLKFSSLIKIIEGCEIALCHKALSKVEECHSFLDEMAKEEVPHYGVNTGFGYFSREKISKEKRKQLQVNLLKSHAAGHGKPLSIDETRVAMALRLNVLMKGLAGASKELCLRLCEHINLGLYPVIPSQGSVGASGDLAPLAHLALPLIGEGRVFFNGEEMEAQAALKKASLSPYILKEKEGLALINGTQIMLAVGASAFTALYGITSFANLLAALTAEAFQANPSFLDENIHLARGQIGQIACAKQMASALEGSYLYKTPPRNVQDPYSIRCAPQVHGPSFEALDYARLVIERELNAGTDNPLVFPGEKRIVSGGNFHGQPIAMAFDFAAIALAELGNISERRLELLVNPHQSGLAAFLADEAGIDSGYMALQYLSASLVNENKLLANPACTDSIPGNVGVEDHVSMGMASAKKFKQIGENLLTIYSAELLAACKAIDLRGRSSLGKKSQKLYEELRRAVPKVVGDRIVAKEVQKAREVVRGYAKSEIDV